jgi:hypothetical protein
MNEINNRGMKKLKDYWKYVEEMKNLQTILHAV